MSTFVIVCGGTGGHLSPGIAIAERLLERGHSCRLVVSRKQVDSRLCRKYTRLQFVQSPGAGFSWKPFGFIRFWLEFIRGFIFSRRFLLETKPVAVIGFGGFTSLGMVVGARILRIPVILHESNRVPGKAVRLLSRLSKRVYMPAGVHLRSLRPEVVREAGFPLRREMVHIPKVDLRRRQGIAPQTRTLVVFGGSQGASCLNLWVEEHAEALLAAGINIFCITGLGKGQPSERLHKANSGAVVKWVTIPFCDEVNEVLSLADLVVSRAGAGSIAEITECLAPSILVPYPHAADNHQEANARALEQAGGCVLVNQSHLGDLFREVSDLIFNDWMLSRLRENLRSLHRGDVAAQLAEDVERLAGVGPGITVGGVAPAPQFSEVRP